MNRPWVQQITNTLAGTFKKTLKRFPVTVVFSLSLTIYLIYLIATENTETDKKLVWIIGYYLSVGTLLSLTLHLWSEEMLQPIHKTITHILPHGLLIADALFLYSLSPDQSLTEIGIAHLGDARALIVNKDGKVNSLIRESKSTIYRPYILFRYDITLFRCDYQEISLIIFDIIYIFY